jgi:inorganic pyrophosphatase
MNVDICIEISKNSNIKYEYDEKLGALRLDRVLKSPMVYPENYGYLPNTLAPDGDPLDVILIADYSLLPGSYIKVRIVGILDMEDEKGIDHKIIAVPATMVDSTYEYVNDINDLPASRLNKIKFFFENYKQLDNDKWVIVNSYKNKDDALKIYNDTLVCPVTKTLQNIVELHPFS